MSSRISVFLVAVLGVLVLISSFLPWYRVTWIEYADGPAASHTVAADAWSASAWWTAAVLLSLAGAVLWAFPQTRGWLPVTFALVATALTVWVWLRHPHSGNTIPDGWLAGYRGLPVGTIARDNLPVDHVPGLDRDVDWGVWAGTATMALLTALLAAAAWGRRLTH